MRFVALLLILVSAASMAAAQSARRDPAQQAALVTEFDVNGMKVLIKRRPLSQTVAAGLFIRGGARNLSPENAGIESMMLNAAGEGSTGFPRAQLRRELSRLGSSINAGTNYDYSVMAMASTREAFDRTWAVFTDTVLRPTFAPADVELARERLITGLRNTEDDPDGFLQELVKRRINAGTSYASDPSGTIANITKFRPADLKAYHQSVMQGSRLLLVIVGDLDAEMLKRRVADSFGRLPRGTYTDPKAPSFDFSKTTLDVTQRPLPTNYIQGVFAAPSVSDPDYYAMRVAVNLLRDRVFEEVRVKRNLSYAPSADMGSLAGNTANIYVSAVDANRAVTVMLNEISLLKTSQVTQRDLDGVAGQFLTTYFIGQETNAAQAAELARYELIGGGWRNSFRFLEGIRKVKPEDVMRVAQKYMKNIRFIVVGNPQAINRDVFSYGDR